MDPTLPPPFPPPLLPDTTATEALAAMTAVVDPTTTAATEAQNHIAHAANPSPNLAPALNHSHPPYAEMIYAAITALKERNGSSKRAIAKYIERFYSGLPPTHSALLTHHLKRLKNSGLLVMIKKSYKLPRSESSDASSSAAASLSGPQKGQGRSRGRPPKPKIVPNPISNPNPEPNAQPVLIALGLVDEPIAQPDVVKRGPGRPRKTGPVGQDGLIKRGRGRPPGSRVGAKPRLNKKTPKPKSVTMLGPNGMKRGPGRPPKAQLRTMIIPFASNNVPAVAVAPVANVTRPRGRPKKDAAAPIHLVYGADGGDVLPGGPAKAVQVRKLKKTTGRPVGRPKKNAAAAISVISDLQPMAYVDLKRKLEYIQSKVKEVVDVLKPQITEESAISAVAELEGLATMDIITAPLQIESQQPQQTQQPQLLPQPQLPPQLQQTFAP